MMAERIDEYIDNVPERSERNGEKYEGTFKVS